MSGVGSRVAAALLALALVIGAVFGRRAIDDKGAQARGPLRIACTPEVVDACRAAAAPFERTEVSSVGGPQLARALRGAAADSTPYDAVVGAGPWATAALLGASGTTTPALRVTGKALARSPLEIVGYKDRLQALRSWCKDGEVTLKCLALATDEGRWSSIGGSSAWGTVDIAHDAPDDSGVGAAVLGAVTADWFATDAVSTSDLDDDAFASVFASLERRSAAAGSGSALATALTNIAAVEIAISTEAEVSQLRVTAKARSATEVIPTPYTVSVEAAVVDGTQRSDDAAAFVRSAALVDALAAAGWRRAPDFRGGAGKVLAADDGLPSPGFLLAVADRRKELIR